jgi:hypothetical protein
MPLSSVSPKSLAAYACPSQKATSAKYPSKLLASDCVEPLPS